MSSVWASSSMCGTLGVPDAKTWAARAAELEVVVVVAVLGAEAHELDERRAHPPARAWT